MQTYEETTSAEIINILNRDKKARNILQKLNQKATEFNLSDAEYSKAREIVLLAAIYQSDEAMQLLSDETWKRLQEKEGA
jgi:hypothetical protein